MFSTVYVNTLMEGFLISNKDLRETSYFVKKKVQVHIPYGVAFEIARV